MSRASLRWLRSRAENIAALMLAVMFAAFVVQIVFRYAFNWPTGWTSELTLVMWLWLVLFGSAFVLGEKDEIRFDLIYSRVRPRVRIAMALVCALAMLALYGAALKATWAYILFMKVERSSYLKIRMDVLFSIFGIFMLAIVVRYVFLLVGLLKGKDPEASDVTNASSGL
ncbi:MAG TPA: TRAP transporter small permease subunit [Burkholderiales bacterium]|nr:TRAP transporter small permease subunit [Burkholderiales bacterium]